MKVVTSGYRYLDIDAYGGIIAYAELLNLLGEPAIAASTAPLNESITPTIHSWQAELTRGYQQAPDDEFVLIDISEPEFFDTFVDRSKVAEILDHHPEFIEYWAERPATKAQIEFIGAACTLVYEQWVKTGKLEQISSTSARLLIAGILDNTLNFRAGVTTDRDRAAYAGLMEHANLPADWPAQYFGECQEQALADLKTVIRGDIKVTTYQSFGRKTAVGQLVVWNAKEMVATRLSEIEDSMAGQADDWFMSLISLVEGRNYFITTVPAVQQFLERFLNVRFVGSVAVADRLWLRKEIMKKDMEHKR
ncbi:MAG TPA: DHH family phosphoesterase [Candidatus Saccharimonadales bacterium]|nr:DHH family phosphoesterase [Candidatus Saccharimonadales bacterium]